MPLDLSKLECVRCADDRTHARCPACAEIGGDKKGEHLMIDPQGRFGCAVYAGDLGHRSRIWALAGVRDGKPSFGFTPRPVPIRRAFQASDASDGTSRVGTECRSVWYKSSDASDGTFYPFSVLGEYSNSGSVAVQPSEPSEIPSSRIPTSPPPANIGPSVIAATAPQLIPRDAPFVEGQRYRLSCSFGKGA